MSENQLIDGEYLVLSFQNKEAECKKRIQQLPLNEQILLQQACHLLAWWVAQVRRDKVTHYE